MPCRISGLALTPAGTGKEDGDRHPKISDNVLIGACARVLGNIHVGKGAQASGDVLGCRAVRCCMYNRPRL